MKNFWFVCCLVVISVCVYVSIADKKSDETIEINAIVLHKFTGLEYGNTVYGIDAQATDFEYTTTLYISGQKYRAITEGEQVTIHISKYWKNPTIQTAWMIFEGICMGIVLLVSLCLAVVGVIVTLAYVIK